MDMANVALVLGAGGAAGTAFHAGALAALAEISGWDPRTANVIVGTSAGSTTTGLLRAGLSAADLYQHMTGQPMSAAGAELMRQTTAHSTSSTSGQTTKSRFSSLPLPVAPGLALDLAKRPRRMKPITFGAAMAPAGRHRAELLGRPFVGLHPGRWPQQDTWICAVDVDAGRRVVFGRDDRVAPMGLAIAASCAIPAYYAPVTIGDRRYVDGAAHSVHNADLISPDGLDAVVVSAPMSVTDQSGFSLDSAIRQGIRRQLRAELRHLEQQGIPIITLAPGPRDRRVMSGNSMDLAMRPAIAQVVKSSTMWFLTEKSPEYIRSLRT